MIHPKELFPQPLAQTNHFRANRAARFALMVENILARQERCRIIDIGGVPDYWRCYASDIVNDPRVSILLINNDYNELHNLALNDCERRAISLTTGDARNLGDFADKSFDLAHSNSVIEHVGLWSDMSAMAKETRRVARWHFVQTPYWWFPIEPHNRTALFHWLPEQARYRLVMNHKLGFWSRAANVDEAMRTVQSAILLDRRQFAELFPSSSIYSELAFGLTKSLIAIGGEGLSVDPRSNTRQLRI